MSQNFERPPNSRPPNSLSSYGFNPGSDEQSANAPPTSTSTSTNDILPASTPANSTTLNQTTTTPTMAQRAHDLTTGYKTLTKKVIAQILRNRRLPCTAPTKDDLIYRLVQADIADFQQLEAQALSQSLLRPSVPPATPRHHSRPILQDLTNLHDDSSHQTPRRARAPSKINLPGDSSRQTPQRARAPSKQPITPARASSKPPFTRAFHDPTRYIPPSNT